MRHVDRKRTYTRASSYASGTNRLCALCWPRGWKQNDPNADRPLCLARYFTRCERFCEEMPQVSGKQPATKKRVPLTFLPSERFTTVHIDIVGPLPISSTGKTYLLTMIDRFTGWLEAVPTSSITADTCAKLFIEHWISRFGVPEIVISDQGPQFEAFIFKKILAYLGVDKRRTTAYHPQTNGKVERAHKTLKSSLRCLSHRFRDWECALPSALFAFRSALNEHGFSATQLTLGTQVRLPSDLLVPISPHSSGVHSQQQEVSQLANQFAIVKEHFLINHNELPVDLRPVATTGYVWLRTPGIKPSMIFLYVGPYEVLRQNGPLLVIDEGGVEKFVNVDRTRPAFGLQPLYNEPADTPDVTPPPHLNETNQLPHIDTAAADQIPGVLDPELDPALQPQVRLDRCLPAPTMDQPVETSRRTRYGRVSIPPDRFSVSMIRE